MSPMIRLFWKTTKADEETDEITDEHLFKPSLRYGRIVPFDIEEVAENFAVMRPPQDDDELIFSMESSESPALGTTMKMQRQKEKEDAALAKSVMLGAAAAAPATSSGGPTGAAGAASLARRGSFRRFSGAVTSKGMNSRIEAKKVSEEQRAALKKVFDAVDIDGSGNLDKGEVCLAMIRLGLSPTISEITELMNNITLNETLNVDEFVTLVTHFQGKKSMLRVITMDEAMKSYTKPLQRSMPTISGLAHTIRNPTTITGLTEYDRERFLEYIPIKRKQYRLESVRFIDSVNYRLGRHAMSLRHHWKINVLEDFYGKNVVGQLLFAIFEVGMWVLVYLALWQEIFSEVFALIVVLFWDYVVGLMAIDTVTFVVRTLTLLYILARSIIILVTDRTFVMIVLVMYFFLSSVVNLFLAVMNLLAVYIRKPVGDTTEKRRDLAFAYYLGDKFEYKIFGLTYLIAMRQAAAVLIGLIQLATAFIMILFESIIEFIDAMIDWYKYFYQQKNVTADTIDVQLHQKYITEYASYSNKTNENNGVMGDSGSGGGGGGGAGGGGQRRYRDNDFFDDEEGEEEDLDDDNDGILYDQAELQRRLGAQQGQQVAAYGPSGMALHMAVPQQQQQQSKTIRFHGDLNPDDNAHADTFEPSGEELVFFVLEGQAMIVNCVMSSWFDDYYDLVDNIRLSIRYPGPADDVQLKFRGKVLTPSDFVVSTSPQDPIVVSLLNTGNAAVVNVMHGVAAAHPMGHITRKQQQRRIVPSMVKLPGSTPRRSSLDLNNSINVPGRRASLDGPQRRGSLEASHRGRRQSIEGLMASLSQRPPGLLSPHAQRTRHGTVSPSNSQSPSRPTPRAGTAAERRSRIQDALETAINLSNQLHVPGQWEQENRVSEQAPQSAGTDADRQRELEENAHDKAMMTMQNLAKRHAERRASINLEASVLAGLGRRGSASGATANLLSNNDSFGVRGTAPVSTPNASGVFTPAASLSKSVVGRGNPFAVFFRRRGSQQQSDLPPTPVRRTSRSNNTPTKSANFKITSPIRNSDITVDLPTPNPLRNTATVQLSSASGEVAAAPPSHDPRFTVANLVDDDNDGGERSPHPSHNILAAFANRRVERRRETMPPMDSGHTAGVNNSNSNNNTNNNSSDPTTSTSRPRLPAEAGPASERCITELSRDGSHSDGGENTVTKVSKNVPYE
eukprot:PhM_4_TR3103/c0_g1_i1/m.61464